MLEVKALSCGYGEENILEDVNFTVDSGDIVCILGSNGSGKSTLIKTIIGLIKPIKGDILVEGKSILNWPWKRRAQLISYIPQSFNSTFQYRVKDIVLMGRTSYLKFASTPSKEDERIAEEALELLRISHLKDKIYSQLSGGERQLVKIAQALAQQSKIIIMDEPTNNLDFGNQMVMLKHLKNCSEKGITIIMATHLPEHAFLYGSKALLVKNGRVAEIEKPSENLKERDLRELYDVDIELVEFNLDNRNIKMCLPLI